MEVEVIGDSVRLAELAEEWTALEQAVASADDEPGGTYYLSHRFVSAWWRSYRLVPDVELSVLALRHNGHLVGIAPLATRRAERAGQPVTRLRFATHGDYLGFLIHPEAPQETVAKKLLAALESLETWQSARLGGIPVQSPLGQYLLRSDDHNPHFTLHVENPYVDLTRYTDFAEYQDRQLPKHARKWLNRLRRDHPGLRLRVLTGDQDGIFERIGQVHRAERDYLVRQHGRTERHSFFDDPARWGHYHRIFTTTDDARTFVLEASDGTLAGYRTTFRDGRRMLSWNGAYHPDFAEYRIGSALLYLMLEHLFDTRESDVLDLGAGRYAWKFGWTPHFRATYRLRLEREVPAPEQEAEQSRRAPAPTTTASRPAPTGTAGGGPREVERTARTTYVVSPHPDDETLRTAGFLTGPDVADDEQLVLVAVTDGGSSSEARRRGWTPAQEQATRRAEQDAAWAALTRGRGVIVRLGLPDGALTIEAVVTAVREAVPGLGEPGARVVVAAHADDYHADHRAVVRAIRELGPADLATSLAPLMKDPTDAAYLLSVSVPTPERAGAARVAHHAYQEFGQRSVPPEFAALVKQDYRSRLTDPHQPPARPTGPHGAPLPRVLVVGRTRDHLPGEAFEAADGRSPADGDLSTAWSLSWAVGTHPGTAPDPEDLGVEYLTADPRPASKTPIRDLAQKVTGRLPRRPGGEPRRSTEVGHGDWVETLRRRAAAGGLLPEADVILSADAQTDTALARLTDLAPRVVPSTETSAVLAVGRRLEELAQELTDRRTAGALRADDAFTARLGEWRRRAEEVGRALAPVPELTRTWAGTWLRVADLHDPHRIARIRAEVLTAVPWETTGHGAALRAALSLEAELTLGRGSSDPSAVARDALRAADEAMAARRNHDSLDHLRAALSLLFHPAVHSPWSTSPLVLDPAGYLRPLWSARCFRMLLNRDRDLSPWARRLQDAPSTSADGAPQEPLLLGEDPAALGHRDLHELAAFLGLLHTRPRFSQAKQSPELRTRVWSLAARLLDAGWVQAPGDRRAVFASHLCPPTTRLVVTVSAEDVTAPWLQLVRWERVAEVVAQDEAVASVVRAIAAGLRAEVPVRVADGSDSSDAD